MCAASRKAPLPRILLQWSRKRRTTRRGSLGRSGAGSCSGAVMIIYVAGVCMRDAQMPRRSASACKAAVSDDQQKLHNAIEIAAPGVSHKMVLEILRSLFKANTVTCGAFLALEARCSLDYLALCEHCLSSGEMVCGLDGEYVIFTSEALRRNGERAREPLRDWTRRNGGSPSTSGRS